MTAGTTDRSRVRSVVALCWRLVVDLVVIAVWVGFLTWLFLATAWPQWAFYGLFVLGILGYTRRTGYTASDRR